MIKKTILCLALGVLAAAPAFADDIMATRYGNTTVTTDASGVQTKIYYSADGTFTGKQNDQSFNGTWKLDGGGNICLTFAQPVPGAANPTCVPVSAHKVGDSWKAGDRSVTLVQGIQ